MRDMVRSGSGLWLLVLGAFACSAEAGSGPEQELGDTASVQAAITGTTPRIDVDFWGEVTPPTGVNYTDLAVSSTTIYLARSDRKVEQRPRQAKPPVTQTFNDIGEHIDWVQEGGSDWDLVAAHDGTKKIKRKASGGAPSVMGNYPGGVDGLEAMAATPLSSTQLKIFVVHGPHPALVLRTGVHDRAVAPAAITWLRDPLISAQKS